MSIESLTKEALEVLEQIVEKYPDHNVVMVGHSLGGAVTIRTT
jgi:alpha-beta hydrolase superfamily lysophospholipase